MFECVNHCYNHTSHVMNINCFLLPHVLLKSGCSLNLIPSSYFQSVYSYYRFSHEVVQLEVGYQHVCAHTGQVKTDTPTNRSVLMGFNLYKLLYQHNLQYNMYWQFLLVSPEIIHTMYPLYEYSLVSLYSQIMSIPQ